MNKDQKALLDIRNVIQEYGLTQQEAIDLITNNSNLEAFMALRRAIQENRLTETETQILIKQAVKNLNQSIPHATQPESTNKGEDR